MGPTFLCVCVFPQELQNDLEAEQVKVNSLTHMVVVVDENSGESATAALEDQLQVSQLEYVGNCSCQRLHVRLVNVDDMYGVKLQLSKAQMFGITCQLFVACFNNPVVCLSLSLSVSLS